jgi:hypothetical protein
LLIAKFEGDLAQQAKLPAYEATQSLYGIARSALIATNYLAEGRVRRRDFSPNGFELNIITNRPGSFETVFELVTDPTTMAILGALGLSVAGNFATDFIKSMWRRATGQRADPIIEELEASGSLSGGDLAAVIDAIEPAMRETHKSIGYGANSIVIISGDHNVVSFNGRTKEYVNSSTLDDAIQAKLFSIGSFNANSGYGRAFDLEEGRTIAFQLAQGVDRTTINTILSSISSYARRRRLGDEIASAIALRYNAVVSTDGRVKKLIVLGARPNVADFGP